MSVMMRKTRRMWKMCDYDDETPPRFDFQYLWARSGEEVRSLSSGSCPLSGTPSHAVDLGSTSPFLPFSPHQHLLPLWKHSTLLLSSTNAPMLHALKDTLSFDNAAQEDATHAHSSYWVSTVHCVRTRYFGCHSPIMVILELLPHKHFPLLLFVGWSSLLKIHIKPPGKGEHHATVVNMIGWLENAFKIAWV